MYTDTRHNGAPRAGRTGRVKATIVDIRYRMRDVLRALDRNEEVTILYHGKVKGVIRPAAREGTLRVEDHPFFGMCQDGPPVEEVIDGLRGVRRHDV